MSGLIGKKIGMTSIYDASGKVVPCTVLEAGPCVVTQVKTVEKDGYSAIQLAYDEKKEKNTTKSLKGHFAKAGTTPKKILREFTRFEEGHQKSLGDVLDVTVFEEGEFVDVSGTSKGKGFQGVVKRHHFGGVGDATHGQHNRLRAPGSMGASSYPWLTAILLSVVTSARSTSSALAPFSFQEFTAAAKSLNPCSVP